MSFDRIRQVLSVALKSALALSVLAIIALIYLDVQLQNKFEGKRWKIPAKVYARPLELYVGATMTQRDLLDELRRLQYRSETDAAQPGTYVVVGSRVDVHTRGFQFWDGEEHSRQISIVFQAGAIRFLSERGHSVHLVRLEPVKIGGIYSAEQEDRQLVRLASVPDELTRALLAVEDRGFYEHRGLSLRGITRAFWVNVNQGGWVQGGSTITQQLIKNLYLSNKRTLGRKGLEAVLALLLELHYSKEEILEAYLNEVYLGQQGARAIHGVGLASRYYFGRPIEELRSEQIALLVGMIKGPSLYNPIRNPHQALKRRNQVLTIMSATDILSHDELEALKERPLGLVEGVARSANLYPGFMTLVKRQLSKTYAAEDLQEEGLQIFTTLDPHAQQLAEQALQRSVKALNRKETKKSEQLQGGFIVTSPNNGEVLALVGGRDPRFDGFNRVLDARRQVGSIIKPAVFLSALEMREQYQLTTRVNDAAFSLVLPSGKSWSPKNFDRKSHGQPMMIDALVHSYNVATAQLAMDVGLDKLLDVIRRLGVDQALPQLPSISLGAVELTPFEVAQMYQTIAADGFTSPVRAIREILDGEGKPLKRYPLKVKQAFDPSAIALLQYALQEVMNRGTGVSAYGRLPRTLGLAGKTGTTNDQRDSWFAGMGGDYLAVAWLGRDDNGATHLTGSSGALKVWTRFMQDAKVKPFQWTPPPDIELAWVDRESGHLTQQNCPGSVQVAIDLRYQDLEHQSCIRKRVNRWLEKVF